MAPSAHALASGDGWRADDVICTATARDRPFEEQHDRMCIAIVTAGSFRYRCEHGTAVLVPGSVLLGNDRQCFECGHEHSAGDRCLSFHLSPAALETVAAEVPGTRRLGFPAASLPPLATLLPITTAAETARDDGDDTALEELALRLAGVVFASFTGAQHSSHAPSRRDTQRIAATVRRIQTEAHQPLSLDTLARGVAMSPYHFLRTFRSVVGLTPYQYVLRTRLHRAAVRLRRTNEPILSVALDAGFDDLSTFNRRFRRLMGKSPGAYRSGT